MVIQVNFATHLPKYLSRQLFTWAVTQRGYLCTWALPWAVFNPMYPRAIFKTICSGGWGRGVVIIPLTLKSTILMDFANSVFYGGIDFFSSHMLSKFPGVWAKKFKSYLRFYIFSQILSNLTKEDIKERSKSFKWNWRLFQGCVKGDFSRFQDVLTLIIPGYFQNNLSRGGK